MEPQDPIYEARRQWITRGWVHSASGMAALTTIVRVNEILMARISAVMRSNDLTFSRFEVMRLLDFTRVGGLPMGSTSGKSTDGSLNGRRPSRFRGA